MTKPHTTINQLILDTKDLSMFPITRTIYAGKRVWQVTDLREGACPIPRFFKTKRAAQVAICAVVKKAMQ
jgi:hypothetical protein